MGVMTRYGRRTGTVAGYGYGVEIGVGQDDNVTDRLALGVENNGRVIWDCYRQSGRVSEFTSNNSKGLYVGSRLNSSSNTLYKDGVQIAGSSSASGNQPDAEVYFYGMNDYSTEDYPVKFVSESTCEFFALGDGLTLAETQALTTLYNTFRTGVRTV